MDVSTVPQQLWPAGQSQEYRQWNGASLLFHDVVVPDTQRPVGLREIETQHVLDRTSQVGVPQVATV